MVTAARVDIAAGNGLLSLLMLQSFGKRIRPEQNCPLSPISFPILFAENEIIVIKNEIAPMLFFFFFHYRLPFH